MNVQKALKMSIFWIALAMLFNAGIYVYQGPVKAVEFFTSYLIELSLSVDNIFVFLLIFSYFKVTGEEQSKILFWGILGAQVMRLIFIVIGISLLQKYHWVIYIFGAFLVFTGVKLFTDKDKDVPIEDNPVLKFLRKFFPSLSRFWVVLILVEVTDLIFAVDSIPAVLAITQDRFIAYSSNVFAIIGLRSMYFVLASFTSVFHYMHYALGSILIFVGTKMLLEHYIKVPVVLTLGFIASALTISIVFSLRKTK